MAYTVKDKPVLKNVACYKYISMPLKITTLFIAIFIYSISIAGNLNDSLPLKKISCFPALLEGNEKYCTEYILQFAEKRRGYLIRIWTRGKNFFPKVKSIFTKYRVPEEFRVLIALESGFNAKARSRAGAYGYWQIMDEVAREYGLRISTSKMKAVKGKTPVDDRTNFNRSTSAAAKYLRDRMRNLNNDPLLIAASYNWGVGNVWNAMERTGKKSPTFWDIRRFLPAETKAYVMNFIALNVIFHNYEDFLNNSLSFETTTDASEGTVAFSK